MTCIPRDRPQKRIPRSFSRFRCNDSHRPGHFSPDVSGCGSSSRDDAPTPYRGYYYHILTRQGKNAPGGVNRYIVNGKMTGGFAFVAYPAEYRSSGVMTFIVGVDGV